jgi:MFS family permease
MAIGLVMLALFVRHGLRRGDAALIDLRLFANRTFSAASGTLILVIIAVFGGMLLIPLYLQTVRGETAMDTGLLTAPQGLGAMLAMPIAGLLADRTGVGRIVPVGLAVILIGMFGFTQVTDTTSYPVLIAFLVVMGFGMGATMMPLFTSALKTLSAHEVARGSTLLNITQQIAASVGVATLSVILTSQLKGADGPPARADAFAHTYWVAWAIIVVTLVPAFFLPRKHEESRLLADEVIVH